MILPDLPLYVKTVGNGIGCLLRIMNHQNNVQVLEHIVSRNVDIIQLRYSSTKQFMITGTFSVIGHFQAPASIADHGIDAFLAIVDLLRYYIRCPPNGLSIYPGYSACTRRKRAHHGNMRYP